MTGLLARGAAFIATAIPLGVVDAGNSWPFVLAFATAWAAAALASPRLPPDIALVSEGLVITMIGTAGAVTTGHLPLACLAVTPFLGGLRRGAVGTVSCLVAQTTVIGIGVVVAPEAVTVETSTDAVTGLLLGLGLGLIATFVRSTVSSRDAITPYLDARVLLEELLSLSERLDAGLDARAIGARMLTQVQDALPTHEIAVWDARDGTLLPLVTGSRLEPEDHGQPHASRLAERSTDGTTPLVEGSTFALPLHTVVGRVAVVTGELSRGMTSNPRQVVGKLRQLSQSLQPVTVQLDAALMFDEVRSAATRDERRRLSREMHDGVAQDIASMAYLLDVVAEDLPAGVAPQIELLRSTISRVVTEVRASVSALRTDVDANQSLGQAVSGLARRLSASSGISIRCTVDERTTRLSPHVESELVRITQEALTNAVKHSGARAIDVTCQVDAPRARIVVRDNGIGLGQHRSDSHGLTIMRERAALVGAALTIDSSQLGTVVYVSLGSRAGASRPPAEEVPYP